MILQGNLMMKYLKKINVPDYILIFHGTFGEDKCNEIMKTQHHHRHSHHHHHHHHHPDNQKTENLNENEDKRKLAFKC